MNQKELMEPRKIFFKSDLTVEDHKKVKEMLKAVQIPEHHSRNPAAYMRMKQMHFENEILAQKQLEYDSKMEQAIRQYTEKCCKCGKELLNAGGHVIKNNKVYCFDCYLIENPVTKSWRDCLIEDDAL